MKWLVTTSALLFLTLSAHAATWFVDKDNTGIEDGTSWATAFIMIQPAIDAAFADGGGDVWVAEGTYDEGRTSLVHSPAIDTGSLIMKAGVDLFGGFTGVETMINERDFVNNVTTIDGSIARSGSPAYHVVFVEGTSVIDGFTIMGGVAANIGNPLQSRNGGGLFNSADGASVRNCTFTANSAPNGNGGGLRSLEQITIENSTFTSNSSFLGGGGVTTSDPATVTNCLFESNSVSNGGGGGLSLSGTGSSTVTDSAFLGNNASGSAALRSSVSNATISRCTFRNNESANSEVAILVGSSVPNTQSLVNCIIANNDGSGLGTTGVIQMDASPSTEAIVTNCTFWGNTTTSDGGAIRTNGTTLNVVNTILWDNGSDQLVFGIGSDEFITFSDVQGGFPGTGNINAEPFFVDAANGDFRVFSGSPVIDAGTSAGAPATDIDGIARPQGAEVDMGAHESDGSLPLLDAATRIALVALAAILLCCAGYRATSLHAGRSWRASR